MRWAEGREVIEKKIVYESVAERRNISRRPGREPFDAPSRRLVGERSKLRPSKGD